MVIEKKKFGFKAVKVILDDEAARQIIKSGGYAEIEILSYQDLGLGPDFIVRNKKTANIYFDGGIEEIFKRFNDTARNEVRKSEKNERLNVSVGDISKDNLEEIFRLYKDFQAARSGRLMKRPDFLGLGFAVAHLDGEPISAITFYKSKPYLRVRSIFSKRLLADDHELKQLIGTATRRLIYEICKWGSQNSYLRLDLASVNLTDPAKAGITQFKLSFGGRIEDEYTHIYKNRFYLLYERIKRLFQ